MRFHLCTECTLIIFCRWMAKCWANAGFYQVFVSKISAPFILCAVLTCLGLLYKVLSGMMMRGNPSALQVQRSETYNRLRSIGLFGLSLFHPVVSQMVFVIWQCEQFLGIPKPRLSVQPSYECDVGLWYLNLFIGISVLFVFVLGYPLMCAFVLRRRHYMFRMWSMFVQEEVTGPPPPNPWAEQVVAPSIFKQILNRIAAAKAIRAGPDEAELRAEVKTLTVTERVAKLFDARSSYEQLQFLHRDYKDDHYYWEIVEIIYKALFIGLPIILTQLTKLEGFGIILGNFLVFCFFGWHLFTWPHMKSRDDKFEMLILITQFLTTFCLLLLAKAQGVDGGGESGIDIDPALIGWVLLASQFVVVALSLFIILFTIKDVLFVLWHGLVDCILRRPAKSMHTTNMFMGVVKLKIMVYRRNKARRARKTKSLHRSKSRATAGIRPATASENPAPRTIKGAFDPDVVDGDLVMGKAPKLPRPVPGPDAARSFPKGLKPITRGGMSSGSKHNSRTLGVEKPQETRSSRSDRNRHTDSVAEGKRHHPEMPIDKQVSRSRPRSKHEGAQRDSAGQPRTKRSSSRKAQRVEQGRSEDTRVQVGEIGALKAGRGKRRSKKPEDVEV